MRIGKIFVITCLFLYSNPFKARVMALSDMEYCATSFDTIYYDDSGNVVKIENYIIKNETISELQYRIEHEVNNGKGLKDSVRYYYRKDADSLILDKIITLFFDFEKNLVKKETVKYMDPRIVSPNEVVILYKYDKYNRLVKKEQKSVSTKRLNNQTIFVDKYTYSSNTIFIKNYIRAYYNRRGRKLLFPRNEYHFCRTDSLDERGLIKCSIDKYIDGVSEKTLFFYNNNNNVISIDFFSIDDDGCHFLYGERNEYVYESGKLRKIIHKTIVQEPERVDF